jgi:hypothetical protein
LAKADENEEDFDAFNAETFANDGDGEAWDENEHDKFLELEEKGSNDGPSNNRTLEKNADEETEVETFASYSRQDAARDQILNLKQQLNNNNNNNLNGNSNMNNGVNQFGTIGQPAKQSTLNSLPFDVS